MIIVLILTVIFAAMIVMGALEHWSGLAGTILWILAILAGACIALTIDFLSWIESRLRVAANAIEEAQVK